MTTLLYHTPPRSSLRALPAALLAALLALPGMVQAQDYYVIGGGGGGGLAPSLQGTEALGGAAADTGGWPGGNSKSRYTSGGGGGAGASTNAPGDYANCHGWFDGTGINPDNRRFDAPARPNLGSFHLAPLLGAGAGGSAHESESDLTVDTLRILGGHGGGGAGAAAVNGQPGGAGGEVGLTVTGGISAAQSLTVSSGKVGAKGADNGSATGGAGGAGGAASLKVAGTIMAKTLSAHRNDGALSLKAGLLDVTKHDTTLTLAGTRASTYEPETRSEVYFTSLRLGDPSLTVQSINNGQASIGSLTLTGKGKLVNSVIPLKIGRLIFDGGTLNDSNFEGLWYRRVYIDEDITLGSKGVTVDLSTDFDIARTLTGSGKLSKVGSGTLTLHETNDYTGGTSVYKGLLKLTDPSASGRGEVELVAPTTSLHLNFAGNYGNKITGAGRVIATPGTGTLTLSNSGNNYLGGTELANGTLQLLQPGAAGVGGVLVANDAALQLSFAGDYGKPIAGAGRVIANPGTGGTLILSNSGNTYTGGTAVASGTLELQNLSAVGTGGVQVASGATLRLAGSGAFAGALTGSAGSTLEVPVAGITAPSVQGFGAINFTLPNSITAGGVVLTTGASTNLNGATITVGGSGSIPEIVTLISSASGTPASVSIPSGFTLDTSSGALVLRKLYAINITAGTGGSVDCGGASAVGHGGSLSCKAIPDTSAGYELDGELSASGTATTISCNADTCTLTDIRSAVNITAAFKKKKYSVTIAAATGGSVSCVPDTGIEHGTDTSTCTATEDTGYTFGDMTVTSGTADISCSGLTCTLSKLESDVTVSATFKAAPATTAAVPTLGGAGLALTALALPAFATPALRRRRKQGKKADTLR